MTTQLAHSPGKKYQDLFAACLLCGACEKTCPRNIKITEYVVGARSDFPFLYGRHGAKKNVARLVLSRPKLLEGLVKAGIQLKRLSMLPAESGLRLKLGFLEEGKKQEVSFQGEPDRQEVDGAFQYFSGCLAGYLQPSVAQATGELYERLTGGKLTAPKTQVCCGLAAWSSGDIEQARSLAKKNIIAFENAESPILTSCASCSSYLCTYPDLFVDEPQWQERAVSFSKRVLEFSSFFMNALKEQELWTESHVPLYYHEPCHLRFDQHTRQATHKLIDKIQNITRIDSPDNWHCCGQGGLFSLGYPELSEQIFAKAFQGLPSAKASVVVTTCSGCLLQWQAGLASCDCPVVAEHLAVFLLKNVGFGDGATPGEYGR